jgi:hypothetical protein
MSAVVKPKEETMFSVKDLVSGVYLRSARKAGMLSDGALKTMSLPARGTEWLLCAGLAPALFEQVHAGAAVTCSSRVVRVGGIAHLVLCQRCGEWEHRFVLQMLGATMRQFMRRMEGRCLRTMFFCLETGRSDYRGMPAHVWQADASEQDVCEFNDDLERPLAALMEVGSRCLGVSGADGFSMAKDAYVSLVMAPEYVLAANARAGIC